MVDPNKKFVFLGCGAVAKGALDFLDQFIEGINHKNIIMIDSRDLRSNSTISKKVSQGAHFIQLHLKSGHYAALFELLQLKPLDAIVDLTTCTNGLEIATVCRKMSLLLVNTSFEIDAHFTESSTLYDVSLWKRHVDIQKMNQETKDERNATHVLDFGMNPGLVSHMAFHGLRVIAAEALKARPDDKELAKYLSELDYPRMARHMGLQTIHCSEIDTQVARNIPEDSKEFVNTWSVVGMLEEGLEPCQVGWGTHEKAMPAKGQLIGPHHLAIDNPAYKQIHVSWVPDQEILGVVIGHGESCTLPMALEAEDYAPTMHYVYQMCRQTRAQLKKFSYEELVKMKNWRVLNAEDDDLEGEDRVGVLFIFPKNPITLEEKVYTHWTGTILGQGLSKKFGPTIIQVVGGVLTALKYCVEHPDKGFLFPEMIPNDYVMKHASPYLGKVLSIPTPWQPPSAQFTELSKLAAEKLAADPSLI